MASTADVPSRPRQSPHVLIIYTGGTFGMNAQVSQDVQEGSSEGEPSFPKTLDVPEIAPSELKTKFLKSVPELRQLARCSVEIFLNRDSAHISPQHWASLARLIQSRWDGFDGVVVLHGTDTMAYTACALSFLLRPCRKPVIITGAQKPLSALRSDARRNLISAVEIAATGPRPLVNRVSVFFDDRLLQGNRVHKRSAYSYGAFESPHYPPLAQVGTDIRYNSALDRGRHKSFLGNFQQHTNTAEAGPFEARHLGFKSAFDSNIPVFHVTPGFPGQILGNRLLSQVSAVVLNVFPSGTAPTHDPGFVGFLKAARKKKIPVVVVSAGGSPATYAAGRGLIELGCHWAGEMTLECAYVKTAWILGQSRARKSGRKAAKNPLSFAECWNEDFAGEGSAGA